MGLLIGASALTICEIFDLIIYNSFLKIWYHHIKRIAVSALNLKSNEEKPNIDDVDHTPVTKFNPETDDKYVSMLKY